jgi:hypothetical protein
MTTSRVNQPSNRCEVCGFNACQCPRDSVAAASAKPLYEGTGSSPIPKATTVHRGWPGGEA